NSPSSPTKDFWSMIRFFLGYKLVGVEVDLFFRARANNLSSLRSSLIIYMVKYLKKILSSNYINLT
ncbi:hypothetical protein FRX31_025016, partial [Thalictrum thalictroides]